MANEVTKLTEDEFYERFTPVENHIDDNASFDGCMFETYGEEIEYVKTKPDNLWTIVEGDDDTMFYESGFHLVNRVGFLITEEPVEGIISVQLEF